MRTRSTAVAMVFGRRLWQMIPALVLACLGFQATAADARSVSYKLDIPAQSLNDALQALALVSQHKLLYSSELVDGKSAPALRGEFTAEQAVRELLSGTDLVYEVADGLVLIRAKDEKVPAALGGKREGAAWVEGDGKGVWLAQAETSSPSASSEANRVESTPGTAQDQSLKLEEVVVTAQKREERLKEVPISISVLGGKDLDQSSFQGVTSALNTVSGVSATTSSIGNDTQISVRGVTANGPQFAGASTVAYYMDSVPFGFVKTATVPDPNVYDLERIEVLRGPQGTLYGASAQNGVVRVLTNDANLNEFEFKARGLLSSTDGGGGNYGGDVAINVPVIEGKLAVRGVVDYQNLSGWINTPVATHVNDAELRSYRFKINAQPTDALSIGLSAWITHDNYGAPSTSTPDRTISAAIPEPVSEDYETYAFNFGYEFSDFSLSSTSSYLDYTNNGILDLGVYVPGVPFFSGIPILTDFHSKIFSVRVTQ